jgi:hypothetical protein
MTMAHRNLLLIGLLAGLAMWMAGCGGQATPDLDAAVQTALAQTREADSQIAQAVAATLTASAPQPTAAPVQPTAAPEPAPANTPLPTATPTPVQVEVSPPATPTALPPAAPTPVRIAISPVDGNDGNDFVRSSANENNGRVVLLPGFAPADVEDTPTFRDFINLRVEVFDTRAGLYDGAGIEKVIFRIIADDGLGDVVWELEELRPAFCAFGGNDPACLAIDLAAGAQWPAPFAGGINNNVYLAQIDITPTEGEPTQWRWRFFIDSPDLAGPQPAANTARINSIWVQDGRYVVDFETVGFTPQLPGQHVHFFFDSVPPEQAGMPGSGPWQIYPTANGQPAPSPFTLFTVAQRPPNASQICVLVANANHSVNQGTGNCVALP